MIVFNQFLNNMCRILILLLFFSAVSPGAHFHRPFIRLGSRIVGGEDADIKDFPYQLSLLSYGWHICGATIISETWALTSAKCVYRSNSDEISLRAGSNFEGSEGSLHQAVEIIWHPDYSSNPDFDYAVIKVIYVDKPFPVGTSGVNIIPLAESEPEDGQIATIAGWGASHAGGPSVIQLQKVTVPIISREICQEMYDGSIITARMICAGLAEGGKNVCQGDWGGPLTIDGQIVGIVSWSISCADPEKPGVFSNIADQREWILETIGATYQ